VRVSPSDAKYPQSHAENHRHVQEDASLLLMEKSDRDKWRTGMRWLMAAFYIVAGIGHLLRPDAFLPIVPDFVPMPREIIVLTGLCEFAGAAALLTSRLRKIAGIMLALYALCVWPANIKHAVEGINLPPIPDTWWYHGPRLAFQPVLIWWALFCSGAIDWPRQKDK
jgi:uncharacterized membrane protein